MPFNIVRRVPFQREHILAWAAVLAVAVALPFAIVDTFKAGRVYIFSWQFLEELPHRFTGPGRARFILQPIAAMVLGIRGGLADARNGRQPYVPALLRGDLPRRELLREGLVIIRNLLALGVIMDVAFQLMIYHSVHPGAALLIGPILICPPYVVARSLTAWIKRSAAHSSGASV